jgi:hypothetical protein
MKRIGIAMLLALIALGGVGTAWAYNDDPPLTGPDAIQAP